MTPFTARCLQPSLQLFFLLFAFCSSFSIAASQFALGVSVALFLAILAAEGSTAIERSVIPFFWSALLLLVWLFVTAAAGETPAASMFILKEEWLFCIVPVGLYVCRDSAYAQRLLSTLAVSVTIMGIYGVVQHFTGVHLFSDSQLSTRGPTSIRLAGFFSHPLTYGNYMVTATLFFAGYALFGVRGGWKMSRVLSWSASISGLIAVTLSNSRGPTLALAAGLIALGYLSKKLRYVLVVLMLGVGVAGIASPGLAGRYIEEFRSDTMPGNEDSRLFIWNNSLKIVGDNPLLGVGQGNFETAYGERLRPESGTTKRQAHAHCDMLNFAAIAGLPGLILYLGLWVIVVRYLWRGYRNENATATGQSLCVAALLASIAFFASSLTEATFADEEVRQLLMLLWAVGLSGVRALSLAHEGAQDLGRT